MRGGTFAFGALDPVDFLVTDVVVRAVADVPELEADRAAAVRLLAVEVPDFADFVTLLAVEVPDFADFVALLALLVDVFARVALVTAAGVVAGFVILPRVGVRAVLARTGARKRPVWLSGWVATSSGVPVTTTEPPLLPPSGPRSTM